MPNRGRSSTSRSGRAVSVRALAGGLLVLATATGASADCAWVLWSRLEAKGRQTMLTPVEGFPSFGHCSAKETEASKISDPDRQTMKEIGVTSLTYTCLPDTVDPRGPRGK